MLPKSRLYAVFLIGLGIALVTASVLAGQFLYRDARLAVDPSQSTITVHDPAATVVSADGARSEQVPVTMQRHVAFMDPVTPESAAVRMGVAWVTGNGQPSDLIDASVWGYHIDRVTGLQTTKTVISAIPGLPPQDAELRGVTIKFPIEEQGNQVPVVDQVVRATFPAQLTDSVVEEGRRIDVWRQEVPTVLLAEYFASPVNNGAITDPESGEVKPAMRQHAATRIYEVDHQTGLILSVKENLTESWQVVGSDLSQDILRFDGSTSPEYRAEMFAQAEATPTGEGLLIARWVIGGIGVLLVIVGLVGVFGALGRARRVLSTQKSENGPRHSA